MFETIKVRFAAFSDFLVTFVVTAVVLYVSMNALQLMIPGNFMLIPFAVLVYFISGVWWATLTYPSIKAFEVKSYTPAWILKWRPLFWWPAFIAFVYFSFYIQFKQVGFGGPVFIGTMLFLYSWAGMHIRHARGWGEKMNHDYKIERNRLANLIKTEFEVFCNKRTADTFVSFQTENVEAPRDQMINEVRYALSCIIPEFEFSNAQRIQSSMRTSLGISNIIGTKGFDPWLGLIHDLAGPNFNPINIQKRLEALIDAKGRFVISYT